MSGREALLEQQVTALRAALSPFASVADDHGEGGVERAFVVQSFAGATVQLTDADFARAAEVLALSGGPR